MPEPLPKDAIELLKTDHRKVEQLFSDFEDATTKGRKGKIAAQICTELKIHTSIEEEIFYPALEGKIDQALCEEAYVEHDGAKVLINDIVAGKPTDAFYDAKVKVLSEEIKHHVKEEERFIKGMFSQAKRTDVDLVALRDLMMVRKKELLAIAKAKGLPVAKPRVVKLIKA